MARRKPIIEEPVVEEVKIEEVVEEKPVLKGTAKKATKKNNVKISAPRVNIRKSPSLMADVVTIALQGDKFPLVSDNEDGFYEIEINGNQAFVMKEFATLA